MNGQDRLAGASEIPAERLGEGGPLDVYVAENPAFRLPEEGDTPLILIGAGTGVAPFRAFLQQRADRFLEPQYELMLRARLPGGICTTEQWLAIDGIGRELGNGTIRLTARQTFQFHGVLKRDIKPLIQRINQVLIDSIGGCGDVNRNVLCNPNPVESALHAQVHGWAQRLSEHLFPRSRAYHEIWLDEEPVASGEPESEPLYGET